MKTRTHTRFRRHGLAIVTLAFILALMPLIALAGDLDVTGVIDVETKQSSITLAPGQERPIEIEMVVSGRAADANFTWFRDWELKSDGSFEGSNPETYEVEGRDISPPPSADKFVSVGKVKVADGVAPGEYDLVIDPADFEIVDGTPSIAPRASAFLTVIVEAGPSYELVIDGFHRPVAMDETNIVRANQTVPLKFNIFLVEYNAEGNEVDRDELTELNPLVIELKLQLAQNGEGTGGGNELTEEAATGKAGLRYDAIEGQWIFNWSTKGLAKNTVQELTLTARYEGAEAEVISASFQIR
jgi:hypothetical protein